MAQTSQNVKFHSFFAKEVAQTRFLSFFSRFLCTYIYIYEKDIKKFVFMDTKLPALGAKFF